MSLVVLGGTVTVMAILLYCVLQVELCRIFRLAIPPVRSSYFKTQALEKGMEQNCPKPPPIPCYHCKQALAHFW